MGRSTFILGKKPLPLGSVHLGRLVVDLANPDDSDHDPAPAASLKKIVTPYKDFESVVGSDRGNRVFLKLPILASIARSKRHGFVSHVHAKCGRHHWFEKSTEYYRDIIKLTETREFIETALKQGEPIYLLVGYMTLQDADVTEYEITFKSSDLDLSVPLTLGASLGLGVPVAALLPAGEIDPGVGRSINHDGVIRSRYTVEGEQIFALEYRKVNISLRKVRHGEDGKLGECEWNVLTKHRRAQPSETDDIVGANLNESEEPDEFEFDDDEDDGDWEKLVDKDGDFEFYL